MSSGGLEVSLSIHARIQKVLSEGSNIEKLFFCCFFFNGQGRSKQLFSLEFELHFARKYSATIKYQSFSNYSLSSWSADVHVILVLSFEILFLISSSFASLHLFGVLIRIMVYIQ